MENKQNINSQETEQTKAKRTYSKDRLKSKKPRKKLLISIFTLVIISALTTVTYYYVVYQGIFYKNSLQNRKTYFQAMKSFNDFPGVSELSSEDKQKLMQSTGADYLAGYATGFGPNSNEIEGAKYLLGSNPSQDSISGYIKSIISSKKETALAEGYYQGYILYFWYGNTIVNIAEGETIENYGNSKALEEDKNFAKEQADKTYDEIKSGKVTAKAAAEKLSNDKRLKLNDETNGSIFFETNIADLQNTDDDGRFESVQKVIKTQGKPGLSEINVIVADPGFPKSGKKREVGYFLVYIDVVLRGQSSIDYYNKQYDIARSKIK